MGGSKTSDSVAELSAADYVHLHNHTHYSLLDGLQKIPALTNRINELGMEACAITDHGTMSGAIEFYNESKKAGIKPIIGMETYVAARGHTDKEPGKDKNNFHLILLAMNQQGYKNLMRLSTIAHLEGFYYKPRIDRDLLKEYNEGIIALSGCMGGELSSALREDQLDKARDIASWHKDVFGDRYYIEIQDHSHTWDEQKEVNEKLFTLAEELQIETVISSDAHYLKHEDQDAHEVLLCIQTGSYLNDEKRMSLKEFELHVGDPKDIIERWGGSHPESIRNTAKIAQRCNVDFEFGKILIPKFDVPKGETENSLLKKMTYQGLCDRYLSGSGKSYEDIAVGDAKKFLSKEVIERAEYELGIIHSMGFDGYFLIVSDFITWGKEQGIMFGPGRGSAAGSIVSYAIRITDLDPLEYDLLFERFLNPDRISMPDIDIDIQDNRRDEVIEYCIEKYGQENIAHIVTFGKMAARNAIRDVSRVLEVSYAEADRLAKMVPPPIQGRHIPLEKSLQDVKELTEEYEQNDTARQVFDLAMKLEGTMRSHGVHAAGVVIAPDDIVNHTPLEMSQKGVVTTQYSMNPVEDLGLLKMDFLGLSNLTIIKNTLRIIKAVHNETIVLDDLALDNEKTFDLLGRGETTGVFQFESSGMKRYIKELKPDVFDDIVAMGALYRPGPLTAGLTDRFIARKNGREKVSFEHPSMERALKSTYGVLVYQEQVMQIAQDLCGFSGGEADTLRKAIGKKKRDVMAKMKKQFVEGAQTHGGADKAFAEKFWKDLEGFADYAFNKSHSACYGLIAYWTAYLKAHYPSEFMAALMTSDSGDADRLAIEIAECRTMNIEVLQPDINESFVEFGVVQGKQQIRFGLSAVKNVGVAAVEMIVDARNEDGEFKSIEDFIRRLNSKVVNKKTMDSLVKAGAFDRFNDRATLLFNLEKIISYAQKIQKDINSGQTDLFGGSVSEDMKLELQLDKAPGKLSDKEKLTWERELLGLYLSSHPLAEYEDLLSSYTDISVAKDLKDQSKAELAGMVTNTRTITTKKGDPMAFVTIADYSSEIEVIVFPSTFEDVKDLLEVDTVVALKGKISSTDQNGNTSESKIIASSLAELSKKSRSKKQEKVTKKTPAKKIDSSVERLYIYVGRQYTDESLMKLRSVLGEHPGESEVVLVMDKSTKESLRLPFKVSYDKDINTKLAEIFSEEDVIYR